MESLRLKGFGTLGKFFLQVLWKQDGCLFYDNCFHEAVASGGS
jgi:hypothetical protein